MAESTYISHDAIDYQNQPVTIFSRTGKRQSESAYAKAIEAYNTSKGKQQPGFTILSGGGKQAQIRRGFDAVSQPVQSAITATGKFLGKAGVTGAAHLSGQLQGAPATQDARQVAGQAGQAVAENVVNPMIATPEAAGATAAGTAATLLTGGIAAPAIRASSGLLPAFIRATATATGYATGQQFTGSSRGRPNEQLNRPILAGVLSLTTEGVFGLIRKGFSSTLTQRSQSLFDDDIRSLLQSKYPAIANQGPTGLNAVLSTPKGLSDITQAGVKALRESNKETVDAVFDRLVKSLPRGFKASTRDSIRSNLDEMVKASNAALDDISNSVTRTESNKEISELAKKVTDLVANEFKGSTNVNAAKSVSESLNELTASYRHLRDGAYLLQAMKDAAGEGGLTVQKFQQHVRNTFQSNPGSLTHRAGLLSGRGRNIADTGQVDLSSVLRSPVSVRPGILNKFLQGPRIPYKRSPVGTVPGERGIAATKAGALAVTNQSIKDFLTGE